MFHWFLFFWLFWPLYWNFFTNRMSKMLLAAIRVSQPWQVAGHELPVHFVWDLSALEESGKGFLNNRMGFRGRQSRQMLDQLPRDLHVLKRKKVNASIHISYEEKEPIATVISYSPAHNSCCLMFFGITSILVIHSLLDLEWRKLIHASLCQ